jgi:hypothetical protein
MAITRDHDEIRNWVEDRGGLPAAVLDEQGEPGVLRINYPGYSGDDRLETISWEDWFEQFDDSNLAFVYQEEVSTGQKSRFSKLVRAEE